VAASDIGTPSLLDHLWEPMSLDIAFVEQFMHSRFEFIVYDPNFRVPSFTAIQS